MRVAVLTEVERGVASAVLPVLAEAEGIEIGLVAFSHGGGGKRSRRLARKLKKIKKIGIGGAVNGYRMRRWYGADVAELLRLEPIRTLSDRYSLPFVEVDKTNSDHFAGILEEAGVDLGLSLGNGFIAERIFSVPRYGMINIHHELLPAFRGAQSVIWQLYHRSPESGYTIHEITPTIDGGRILKQEVSPIRFRKTLAETVTHTYSDLILRSAEGLKETLLHFDDHLARAEPQPAGTSYTTPSLAEYRVIERNFQEMKGAGLRGS